MQDNGYLSYHGFMFRSLVRREIPRYPANYLSNVIEKSRTPKVSISYLLFERNLQSSKN